MRIESTVKICGLCTKSPASFTPALKALSLLSLGQFNIARATKKFETILPSMNMRGDKKRLGREKARGIKKRPYKSALH